MVDYIVDEHNIDIESEALKKVKDMIVASCDHASPNNLKEKCFLYDIVANGRNGIDVDKFDYIVHESRACGLGCNFQTSLPYVIVPRSECWVVERIVCVVPVLFVVHKRMLLYIYCIKYEVALFLSSSGNRTYGS
ncbi:hypothetical protein Dimus_031600 [Dionaea muscipula]